MLAVKPARLLLRPNLDAHMQWDHREPATCSVDIRRSSIYTTGISVHLYTGLNVEMPRPRLRSSRTLLRQCSSHRNRIFSWPPPIRSRRTLQKRSVTRPSARPSCSAVRCRGKTVAGASMYEPVASTTDLQSASYQSLGVLFEQRHATGHGRSENETTTNGHAHSVWSDRYDERVKNDSGGVWTS